MSINCVLLKAATLKTAASDGMRRTACRLNNPMKKANQVYLFENMPIAKMDSLDLELNPCTNRDRHNVANAIVLAVRTSPVSSPVRKAIMVAIAMMRPSRAILAVNAPVNKGV